MSDNYKDKIKQQAIKKKLQQKMLRQGIEKLKEQGVDTTEMEERMLGYKLEDKIKPVKPTRQQLSQEKYPTLFLTNEILSGIYQIRNSQNSMVYIGKSKNAEKLWKSIIAKLRNKTFGDYQLQSDYNEIGESYFEFSMLEMIEESEIPMDFYKYKNMVDAHSKGIKSYNPMAQKDRLLYNILKTFVNNNTTFSYQHKFEDCVDGSYLIFDFVVYRKNGVDIKEIIILNPIESNNFKSEEQITRSAQQYQIKVDYCKTSGYKCIVINYDNDGYTLDIQLNMKPYN